MLQSLGIADVPLAVELLCVLLGMLTAIFNVAAGGGSLLTLPLLVEVGLTPQEANATNRMGVLLQGAASTATFARHGKLPWAFARRVVGVTCIGALLGAWAAAVLDEQVFRSALAVLFAMLGTWLTSDAVRRGRRPDAAPTPLRLPFDGPLPRWIWPAMLVIGFYGGFIQGGVGVLILLLLHVVGGQDVVRANATKVFLVMTFTLFSVAVFWSQDLMRWRAGASLAVGGVVGAWLGARYADRVNPRVVERILIVGIYLAAARFAGWL